MSVHPWLELPALLLHLDECLAAATPNARARYGVGPDADPYRGLYVGDEAMARLLAQPLAVTSLGQPGEHPWPALGHALSSGPALDDFETAVVVLALGPEVDLKYERIYSYLQDDIAARRPQVALALDLFCADLISRLAARDRFAPDSPLLRSGILLLGGGPETPLLARSMRLDPQFVRQLLGGAGLDERLAGVAEVLEPSAVEEIPIGADERRRIDDAARRGRSGAEVRLVLRGTDTDTLARLAHQLASQLELRMLRLPAEVDVPAVLLAREGISGLALHVAGLPSGETLRMLARAPVVIVTTDHPSVDVEGRDFEVIDIGAPDPAQRRRWWAAQADGLGEADLDRLAARYRLTGSQIELAGRAARAGSHTPTFDDLAEAARRQTRSRLSQLATRVPATVAWSDLVLPADALTALLELCDRVNNRGTVMRKWAMDRRTSGRLGINALFAGPSGTGKTMAAQAVAAELGLDLFTVDLSSVVSKYIGETEKNLDAIFTASAQADVVLFFDEADALFGKRSQVHDSHDRYANLEISYLLQRMENHDGVAILATNLRQNLDEAFLRRLAFTIRFPFPEEAERRRIWANIWPSEVPRGQLDLDLLARSYKLSGGSIRNVAVGAAFLAAARGSAVELSDVLTAVAREFDKLGGGAGTVRALSVVGSGADPS